jgi:hypothetical protein
VVVTPSPKITLTSSKNPATYHDAITFTAKVTGGAAGANKPASGQVLFTYRTPGKTSNPRPVGLKDGVAQVETKDGELGGTSTSRGVDLIEACYQPKPGVTPGPCVTVRQVVKFVTTTSATVDHETVQAGSPIMVDASVAEPDAKILGDYAWARQMTGFITFYVDGVKAKQYLYNDPAEPPLTASLTLRDLKVGKRVITVTYGGDDMHAASSAKAITVVVNGSPSLISLTANKAKAQAGGPVVFRAVVEAPVGAAGAKSGLPTAAPTGTVTFVVDGKNAGTGIVDKHTGIATWTTKTLKVGTRSVTARYNGDTTYAGVTSTKVTVTVTGGTSAPVPAHPLQPTPPTKSPSSGGALASTGAKVGLLLGGAVALLSVGLGLTLLGGRRKARRHSA